MWGDEKGHLILEVACKTQPRELASPSHVSGPPDAKTHSWETLLAAHTKDSGPGSHILEVVLSVFFAEPQNRGSLYSVAHDILFSSTPGKVSLSLYFLLSPTNISISLFHHQPRF